jgi:hypothetical protein
MTKFEEFLCNYIAYQQINCPPIRHGQALMNCLLEFDRDEYDEISNKLNELDCFYVDAKIDKTLEYLKWAFSQDVSYT